MTRTQVVRTIWLACLAVPVVLLAAPTAHAVDLKQDTSLKWIPADAATFHSSMRIGEQLDIIAKSNAWAKFKEMPVVKKAWQAVLEQWDNPNGPFAEFRAIIEQKENQELLALLQDMIGQEVFVYGGKNSAEFLALLMQIQTANQLAPLKALLSGGPQAANNPLAGIQSILEMLAADPKRLVVPNCIIGFKTKQAAVARKQLGRLETLLKEAEKEAGPLKGRWQRGNLAGGDFLTLRLDGGIVPWEMIDLTNFGLDKADADKLIKHMKGMTFVVCLGVKDDYVLLSLGDSTQVLESLGKGPLLVDRAEFKHLVRHADKKLTNISYSSKAARQVTEGGPERLHDMVHAVTDLLAQGNVPKELHARIEKDLHAFAKDMERFIPKPEATLSFSWMTDRGFEGFTYDWTPDRDADGSKPLTLLQHVGSNPILAWVSRAKVDPQEFDLFVKWIKVAYGYLEKKVRPLFVRLEKTTREMLLPSLADGQSALVIDAKLRSKQWHEKMPASEKPLPMLELGIVLGVTDADLLKKAMREYHAIATDMAQAMRAIFPKDIPENYKVPLPQEQATGAGTVYYYALPAAWGLDKQLAPSAALGTHVAALALSPAHAGRLINRTGFSPDSRPLLDAGGRNLASVVWFDFPQLLSTLEPWIEYGVNQAQLDPDGSLDIVGQVRTGIQILSCFRSYSSATYFEGNVKVTHSETVIRDLPK
jgi:hypothetical protein